MAWIDDEEFRDLSDGELIRRLIQRDVEETQARHLIANRDSAFHWRIVARILTGSGLPRLPR